MANTSTWLSISTMSGSSGQTILTVNAAPNLTSSAKTAVVKAYNPVYNISATTQVTIAQYSPSIEVFPTMVGVPDTGGTYQLSISANCSYFITYPELVTNYSTTAATGDTTITFRVPSTSADTTLVGNIVITDTSGQVSKLVRIEQYGAGAHISYSPSAITIPYSGGAATFSVTADCIYNITKGSGDWYTVIPQTGYTGVTVFTVSSNTANTGATDWTSSITIVGPNGNVGTVAVTQSKMPVVVQIPYTADTSTVDASGETRVITIDTTGLVPSSITVDIEGASGATYTYDNGIITVTFPENTGTERDITVIVNGQTTGGDDAAAVITFPQAEYTTIQIPYTADTSTVDASGETRFIYIDTTGLIESSITISVEGATGITYSYSNGVITVIFPENTGGTKYIGVIINAQIIGGFASATINYKQEPSVNLATPLTFEILSSGTLKWYKEGVNSESPKTIQYKINNGEWVDITSNRTGATINVTAGDEVQFRGDNSGYTKYSDYCSNYFSGGTASFNIKGNIMSLISKENFSGLTTFSTERTFERFFQHTKVIDAVSLILPVSTLTSSCYESMFMNCTSLTTAPELPATTLAYSCYEQMFDNCTSLTQAPSILPATNLSGAIYCYFSMFQDCTSLTKAPALPATTLYDDCYHYMFAGCTSLTQAPELPATTLVASCYSNMFAGCTSLTQAPELPATTLAYYCYGGMFEGCTNLIQAPELPATTLVSQCYYNMFHNCTNLNYIRCLATDITANRCTSYWVQNVSSTGTFVKPVSMTGWSIGNNGIPSGWTVQDEGTIPCTALTLNVDSVITDSGQATYTIAPSNATMYDIEFSSSDTSKAVISQNGAITVLSGGNVTITVRDNYSGLEDSKTITVATTPVPTGTPLTFEIVSGGTIKWKCASSSFRCTIQYKINNGEWVSITSTTGGASFNVATGDEIQFIGDNQRYATGTSYYNFFSGGTASFNIKGNIMSLIDSTGYTTATTLQGGNYSFYRLFFGSKVVDASGLVLPATTLTGYCYSCMFQGCTSLTAAPSTLPAEVLSFNCYQAMFSGCTSLITPIELPSITLANGCYSYMFYGCTSLTQAPELPATTLVTSCYAEMFKNCNNLNYIKCLATPNTSYTSNWVSGVSATGAFVKSSSATTWSTGASGIPSGWTVQDA